MTEFYRGDVVASHAVTAGAAAAVLRAARSSRGNSTPAIASLRWSAKRGASRLRHQPHDTIDHGAGQERQRMRDRCLEFLPGRRSPRAREPPGGRRARSQKADRRQPGGQTSHATGTRRSAQARASSCPTPDAPRIRTPRSPSTSAVAWMLAGGKRQPSAGSVTTKRAPRTSPGLVPGMFSAVSVPPCASTICRLIDSPSPEFWPNASPDGRSV